MPSSSRSLSSLLLALSTSLLLNSCVVELIALGAVVEDNLEDPGAAAKKLPEKVMHDGPQGRYPIAQAAQGVGASVIDPYTGELVNIYGKRAGSLVASSSFGRDKYYLPKLSKYPTATAVEGEPGVYLNPYDSRKVRLKKTQAGALVMSPTAGSFFYLPD